MSSTMLLTTKLTIPPIRSGLVPRPRLLERLEACREHSLTLLAAPAGFGKTMILSAWARQQQHPVAWVSLDSNDNDPVQFWMYVLAALDSVYPGISQASGNLLQSEQPASIEAMLVRLLNDLGTIQQDIVLVLDDYHLIEALPIHRSMTFLLDHLPPQFHLLLASRVDPPLPLSRLRARRQLVELRVDDLRFSFEEAGTFLNEIMGFHLYEHDIVALETRTEGWIAGLQLAALSMQGRKDIAAFVSAFAGSHRYIMDYLTEEVLGQQPEPVRMFLLQTSILDRLNASLVDAVTEQQTGQAMLQHLEQANLFLLPLDDERHWYRYHHLFAEALRFRLTQSHPDLLPTLHQRASVWFEQHDLTPEAVNHALAAHDFERAATLIEPVLYPMFSHGTHATVRHWLQAIPEEVVFARPYLCLQYAWAFMYIGDLASCERPLDAAEQAWLKEGNLPRLGEVYTFRSSMAVVQGDAIRARDYAQRALPLLAEENRVSRCNCTIYLGASRLLLGEVQEAPRLLNEALDLCKTCHLYSTLYSMNLLAEVEMVKGRLHQAAAISREVISTLNDRPSIYSSRAYSRLGRLYYEWNELDQATQFIQHAIHLGEQAGQEIYMSTIYLAAAQVFWVRGEVEEALAVLAKAEQSAQRLGNHLAAEQVRTFRARMELAQGNVAQAEQWSKEAGIDTNDEPGYEHEAAYLMLARLHLAQHRTQEAIKLLERLLITHEAAGRTGNLISVLALQAAAYWQQGNTVQAMLVLNRLLSRAEPEGYLRVLVDEGAPMHELLASWLAFPAGQLPNGVKSTSEKYVQKLLTAFPQTAAKPARGSEGARREETNNTHSPLIEPLSTREQDVLELLGAGLSNAEIAEQLVVSVGTIKTHVKSIYSKLGVHSRTQVIVRAREIGLL